MQIFTNVRRIALFLLSMVLSLGVFAQERTVTGKVSGEGEGPLPGVNVYIQGTTIGTITDLDGAYTISVPGADAVLVYSSVGYITKQVTVGSQSVIDVVLESDVTALQEVVVTGYTTQSKRNISGAIASVDGDELKTLPNASVGQQLQGRAAGLIVSQDGEPGSQVMVRVRGFGSVNNNNPLYIVDGIPVDEWTMQDVNPNDVENIQVLKDASTASIYGARAANGVIIITTKKGSKAGKSNISFDGYYGVQQPGKLIELLNPTELSEVLWEQQKNAGTSPSHPQYGNGATPTLPNYIIPTAASTVDESTYNFYTNAITEANKEGTDWLDEIFEPATIQSYNISGSGGSENGQYSISAGYFDQNGVIINTNYTRYNLRANSTFSVKDRIRVGQTLSLAYTESTGMSGGRNANGNALSMAWRIPSIIPVYDIAGNWAGTRASGMNNPTNPVADLHNNKDNVGRGIRVLGSVYAEVDIVEGLTFKSSFNANFGTSLENKSFTVKTYWNAENNSNASLSQATYNSLNWTWYNTLNYVKTFNDVHNLSVLAGIEAIDNYYTEYGASRVNYFSEALAFRHLSTGAAGTSNYGYASSWALYSLFGKVDYDYQGKYILSATIRRDGSSRFGEDNRYGIFPAVSAAWRMSDESFMQGVSFINDLKIRVGWGQTGNQNIGDYLVYDTYGPDLPTARYSIGGGQNSAVSGFQSSTFGNPNVKWEATTTTDIGFNMALLDNRLTLEFDWYNRLTSDMLLTVPVATLRGIASNPVLNVGEMSNKGIDLTAMWNGKAGTDFKYSVGVNFTQYKNMVEKFYNEDQVINGGFWREYNATRTVQGQPVGSFYGWNWIGIFQTQAEVDAAPDQPGAAPGRWQAEDVNGDDVINADDRTFVGSPHPDFTLGVPMNFGYKKFDLNLFWFSSVGNDLFNANKLYWDMPGYFTNSQKAKTILNSWGYPGVDNAGATLPQINNNAPATEREASSYYVEDGSYLRLAQLTLAYNLPASKAYERLRVYFQANNLLTFTSYTGLDPQVSTPNPNGGGGDLNMGVDQGQYPIVKSFMLGLNVTF